MEREVVTIDSTALGRHAHTVLAWSSSRVAPSLRAAVCTLPESMRAIAYYHFGWSESDGRPTQAKGGKSIRPAFTLVSAAASGSDDPAVAVPAAVAVELVHNFSLLHDDVIDDDLTRRHRPTAWRVFGKNAAVLAGDALQTLAFEVLARADHPAAGQGVALLSETVLRLIEGQAYDLDFETRAEVTLPECEQMVHGKTAALFSGACEVGALFGGGSADQISALRDFGECVGLAFQHVDDLLGIWGDPQVTGKPVFADLRKRKKSLPVVAALNSGTPAGRELALLYCRPEALSDAELTHTAELIELAGGRSWSQAQADALLVRGLDHMRRAGPAEQVAGQLEALAYLVARRDH